MYPIPLSVVVMFILPFAAAEYGTPELICLAVIFLLTRRLAAASTFDEHE